MCSGERQHGLRGVSECGVPEFGGKALGGVVWAVFRSSMVRGVLGGGLSMLHVEVGPWVEM